MKYIDADLLRDRIKKNKYVIEPMFLKGDDSYYEGEDDGYSRILNIIDSLQQEQPEVDFEKELKKERAKLLDAFGPMNGEQCLAIRNFARHFYELGLNARKEDKK